MRRVAEACHAEHRSAHAVRGFALAEGLERAAVHDATHQRAADDVLVHSRDLDEFFQVDAGLDAELVAQENHLVGADIARGLARLVAGERAAAQARDRGIQQALARRQRGVEVGPAKTSPTSNSSKYRPSQPVLTAMILLRLPLVRRIAFGSSADIYYSAF